MKNQLEPQAISLEILREKYAKGDEKDIRAPRITLCHCAQMSDARP